MGLEFLKRVRHVALGLAVIAALFAAVYFTYAAGLGLAAGAVWSLANLWLLERLVVGLTDPRDPRPLLRRIGWALAANVALLGLGALLLFKLPTAPLAIGFTLPFAVIVLKAASRWLLDSGAWRRFTASRWRAAAVIVALIAGVWLLSSTVNRAAGSPAPGHGAAAGALAAEVHDGGAAAESHAEPAESEGPKKFDTILSILVAANRNQPWAHFVHHYEIVIFSVFVGLLLSVIAFVASRKPALIPGPFQNAVESVVELIYQQVVDVLGPKYGPRYVPFLGSLFVYILAMNLFGIFPLMESPTSNLNVTVALALTVFVYVQFTAFRELGLIGWLDHMAGNPRSIVEWGLVPLLFPIHLLGELAKPVSLSCRLFGNIFGEDMLLVGFATLGIGAMAALHLGALPFGLPLQFIFLFLALLTSFVQALVFAMLSTIYFLLMLPHDHAHGHEAEAHHPAH